MPNLPHETRFADEAAAEIHPSPLEESVHHSSIRKMYRILD
nr:hypothetical protein [uncultured Rhodopila sp.]